MTTLGIVARGLLAACAPLGYPLLAGVVRPIAAAGASPVGVRSRV